MKKYNSLNHAKFSIRYHIIFSTKYRRKCLESIEQDIFDCMKQISKESKNFKIIDMGIDKDHIHFVIQSKLTVNVKTIVSELKQKSTYRLWESHKSYLSKYFWGKKKKLWTGGYFVSTIGYVSDTVVLNYIKNQ